MLPARTLVQLPISNLHIQYLPGIRQTPERVRSSSAHRRIVATKPVASQGALVEAASSPRHQGDVSSTPAGVGQLSAQRCSRPPPFALYPLRTTDPIKKPRDSFPPVKPFSMVWAAPHPVSETQFPRWTSPQQTAVPFYRPVCPFRVFPCLCRLPVDTISIF